MAANLPYTSRLFQPHLPITPVEEAKDDQAIPQLVAACRDRPDDPVSCGRLADMYALQQHLALAVDYYNKGILANPHGKFSGGFAKMIAYWSPRQTIFQITNAPPSDYDEAKFRARLNMLLATNEICRAENPLEYDSEMVQIARQMTSGATNELEKARQIYAYVTRLAADRSNIMDCQDLTARQIFSRRAGLTNGLYCQPSTYLYIALCRAAGLKAYFVQVFEACDGNKSAHCCTAVFADSLEFLADPAYSWFGAPHRKFKILDDMQVTGEYLTKVHHESPELLKIAAKLAPGSAVVQYNLAFWLLHDGDLDGAKRALAEIRRLDPDGVWSNALEGDLAFFEGNLQLARKLLQKAIAMDDGDTPLYFQLSQVCAAAGDFEAATTAVKEAISRPHSSDAETQANKILEFLKKDGKL